MSHVTFIKNDTINVGDDWRRYKSDGRNSGGMVRQKETKNALNTAFKTTLTMSPGYPQDISKMPPKYLEHVIEN